MDALIWTVGVVASLYTLVEIAGLLLRADPPGRRRVQRTHEFRQGAAAGFGNAAFGATHGDAYTIDLQPISGRQANYFG